MSLKKAILFLTNLSTKKRNRQERAESSIHLATLLLEAMQHSITRSEKDHEKKIARMMEDPEGRAFLTAMTDQCFRSHDSKRTADQLTFLLTYFGIPRFLSSFDRIKFFYFKILGNFFPSLFVPLVQAQIRHEMDNVLLPENPQERLRYFAICRKEGIRVNLNHLGEAILGEEEAQKRLQIYLDDLKKPEIEYISIKISSIFSQINSINFDQTIEILADRLRQLYRATKKYVYTSSDGRVTPKFVNLDMEESKDVELTVALFQKVLSEAEFADYYAGIALQSYLPESFPVLKRLTEWAMNRPGNIKIRIVKGANLSMEQVDASLHNWPLAPFNHKYETDANFKRMLEYAMNPQQASKVHIGIGSHNLLDIAYALILRRETQTERFVSFEMLEGMAETMQRVVRAVSQGMLLYCPETTSASFQNAVAYLIRRLDENAGPENFLRYLFSLSFEMKHWQDQINSFQNSFNWMDQLTESKKRTQNRYSTPKNLQMDEPFSNEPDTDFSLEANRKWAVEILQKEKKKNTFTIPLVIAGCHMQAEVEKGTDPSHPDEILYYAHNANHEQAEKALYSAKAAQDFWGTQSVEKRAQLLAAVASCFRERRNRLIHAMIADSGKVVSEADIEVSESIDFLEYYWRNWTKILAFKDLRWKLRGTILVAPPWNFPCSIPTGGIAASLMAGNSVLFKPAPETIWVGWEVVQAFWAAGIPQDVLQFIPCPDDSVGSALVKHPLLNGVILTGSTETAKKLMRLRPGLSLFAETGGKNAIIVTAMADRDLAIRDIIQSAFGHAGQKCSACSLVILEKEVYQDARFMQQLRDATQSLPVGSSWDAKTKIPPLVRPAQGPLLKGLTQLEPHESWLLKPKQMTTNQQLWTPGIKLSLPGSFMHVTELFGPVIAVLEANNLTHAIQLANATPYGLTSGLHSLDLREQRLWKDTIEAGNLYINRSITGAIVQRQPFGGCKESSFGPGAKAGGPNYVAQFAIPEQVAMPSERASVPSSIIPLAQIISDFSLSDQEKDTWKNSIESYAYWAKIHLEPSDPSCVLGQDNWFYHVPINTIILRFEKKDSRLDLLRVIGACLICKTPLTVSSEEPLLRIKKLVRCIPESEEVFLRRLENKHRLRVLNPPSAKLQEIAKEKGIVILSQPVLANGRFELLNYLREVSLSVDYHRYGYLGTRKAKSSPVS